MVGMLHVKSEVAGLNPRSQSPERVKNCVTVIGMCDLCIGGSNISIKLSAIGCDIFRQRNSLWKHTGMPSSKKTHSSSKPSREK